ncbi:MAG: cyclic nucleotide-binding domain-containing protein [Chloroflexota bacterium]
MISPELLRRYPFFGQLNDEQLRNLAMIAEQISLENDAVVLQEGQPAQALYFLLDGCVDLYYTVQEAFQQADRKQIPVSQINIGEPFGISALIEPHILTSTARSSGTSRAIRFDAQGLKDLLARDPQLEAVLLRRMAQAAIERLHATRVQLAAAWS